MTDSVPVSSGAARFGVVLRYYATGAVNAAFGYLGYALFVWLGFNIFAAQIGASLLSLGFNYASYSRHVFRGSQPAKLRFLASYVSNYLVSLAALAGAAQFIASPYICGLVAIVAASVVNYFVLKYLVFVARDRA